MINQSIPNTFFKNNRLKLFKQSQADMIIVTANGLLQKSADEHLPFGQDSSFWYLTGLNEPDLILVITQNEEFLIVPSHYTYRQSALADLDSELINQTSAITQIFNEKEGWQKVKKDLKKDCKIATLLPAPALMQYYGFYANPARRRLYAKIKRLSNDVIIIDIRQKIATLRMVKQPIEINLIQKALDITIQTLKEVLTVKNLKNYHDTRTIEQDILSGFIRRGGSGHAFDPIIAIGKNATYIHYNKLADSITSGQLMVCDVGSRYMGYNADITRTVVGHSKASHRQQEVYNAVKEIQQETYKLIKAGIKAKDYEHQVETLVGQQLIKLGIIKKLDHQAIKRYYPHTCSHSLGIDTHDPADYNYPLPENMVMTVEPGIYIKEEGIGVRLEDVVRVTKNGCQLMTADLPTSLYIS